MNPVRKGEEKGKQTSTNLTAVSLGTNRYEDEHNKRTAAENEFVMLKKVRGGWGGLQEAWGLPRRLA